MPKLDLGDGVSLNYSIKGEGIPIVFVHPPVITSVNFNYQMDGLSHKYRIITFDIRGHGQSSFSSSPLTYPLIVEDIKVLLDKLEIEKAFICGYSTGGSIALEFLLTYPNRSLGGIIVSGMSEVSDAYLQKKISLGVKLASAKAKSILAMSISLSNSNTTNLFNKMFVEAKKSHIENIKQYFRCSLQYNCTAQLENIHAPILLVYGKKDTSFHKYAAILQKKLPNNTLKLINENHRIPTKAAYQLNELIKIFVSEKYAQEQYSGRQEQLITENN